MVQGAKDYEPEFILPTEVSDTGVDYVHTKAHQAAYDFSVYLHEKTRRFPKHEKFTLQKDIRQAIDTILDEIEIYEIGGAISHLYTADQNKRRLLRKLRLAHDLGYSAMNNKALLYCAMRLSVIGSLIGGLIKQAQAQKGKKK